MPGHSGALIGEFRANNLDVTEIPGLDNLLQSDGVIKESEALLAKSYNVKNALMVTTGTTTCMQIVMASLKALKYKVICLGKMHTSFYNALRLYDMPYTECNSIECIKVEINKSQTMYAIFTTSPNYFGVVKDVEKLKEITANTNNIVVVDAAHGAHFAFSKLLPTFPGEIADIAMTSLHKTMPCLGGSALLTCNSEKLYNTLCLYREICHSTSPNYVSMASMDYAREDFSAKGEKYYMAIKNEIDSFNGKMASFDIESNDDFSRLVLYKKDVDCYDALLKLHDMGFSIEMAYEDRLVLIVTPYNYLKLKDFEKALESIELKTLVRNEINEGEKSSLDITNLTADFVELDEAIGLIANADIGIYPPSVPVIRYGTKITEGNIKILKANKEHLFGLVNNKVPVLK